MLLLELLVRGSRVLAHADHLIASPLQLAVSVAKAASLGSAAACVVLWVEVKHKLPALIVTQTDVLSVLILAQNLGRTVSNVHSCICLFFPALSARIIHFLK